ncbi:MAG TPA: pilin [Candidatus Saccharimonadales bacterium]|nr:pilin [Candidatus Saccharimonadales bacterium]
MSLVHLASTAQINCGAVDPGSTCDTQLPAVQASDIMTILQYVFGVVGALALVIIVIAGLQFITSNGDPQGVARARSAIIYAAIGLVLCISAEVIVTFVVNNV